MYSIHSIKIEIIFKAKLHSRKSLEVIRKKQCKFNVAYTQWDEFRVNVLWLFYLIRSYLFRQQLNTFIQHRYAIFDIDKHDNGLFRINSVGSPMIFSTVRRRFCFLVSSLHLSFLFLAHYLCVAFFLASHSLFVIQWKWWKMVNLFDTWTVRILGGDMNLDKQKYQPTIGAKNIHRKKKRPPLWERRK